MPVSDWYEEAMERYRAAGLVHANATSPPEQAGLPNVADGAIDDGVNATPDIPDWVARAMDRYKAMESDAAPSRLQELGRQVHESGVDAPAARAVADRPVRLGRLAAAVRVLRGPQRSLATPNRST